jgi:aspartate/methionine/tyrosine aminotransferase
MSQQVRKMQYAVRGEVVIRADQLAHEGRDIIYTNIGNPHSVGQKPITFYRQVLALCDLPAANGVDNPNVYLLFPSDVVDRARELREIVGPSGTGAYTNSQGLAGVRKHVAEFITKRDGHPAYAGDIFLTNGASHAIEQVLTALISCNSDGIMIPIPQYPIYSALITRMGARKIGYELDEDLGWAITKEELGKRLGEAKAKGLTVKGLAMINPGNPTGQVLSRKDLETVCRFCAEHGIVLLADEVYQRNVYAPDREFISAKKVAVETPGCENLQLVSFHSTSKGLIGECGRRGGYAELHHIDPYVHSQLYKLASTGLCSGVAGQIMTSLMVKGPEVGGESYDKFRGEEQGIFESLGRRAKAVVDGLNSIDGIECQKAEGAMYAFPRIHIPQMAVEHAAAQGQTPDSLYALSLLDETGICVVPASGFGQKEGRIGFRTTFLPPEEKLMGAIKEFGRHHKLFCDRFS